MQKWKISEFLSTTTAHDGTVICISGLTGTVLVIEPTWQQPVRNSFATGDIDHLPLWIREQMRAAQIIVPHDADEHAIIAANRHQARAQASSLSLTIAPTMACNLNCPYCYEGDARRSSTMSAAIQNHLIDMLRDRIIPGGELSIVWYGGEPLMGKSVIDRLSHTLIKICAQKQATYEAHIVTNGTLLDEDTINWMLSIDIKHIQVTLDGPAHVHDARRCKADGTSTFHTIVENTRIALDKGLDVVIRINVDRSNADLSLELVDYLHEVELIPGATVAPGQVTDWNSAACADVSESCLCKEEYARFKRKFDEHVLKYSPHSVQPPPVRTLYCTAENPNSYVIDPEGYLFKCWNDVGRPELAFGSVAVPYNKANSNLTRWLARPDPLADERCVNCKVLPLCMGGCPAQSLQKSDQPDERCDLVRYELSQTLNNYYHCLLKSAQGVK